MVDLVEAEEMVRQAIDIAESMAGVQLESVVVSLSGGRLGSERFVANIELAGGAVTDGDIARVLAAASRHSVRDGRAVLHSLPIGYALDAATGIREPRGMLGHRFGVDMHVVTADVATVRNLMLTVERSHLSVEAMVASPYVAGLAVLADDEADLGAACIDLGAGTTTMAVFSGGRFVHADGFALGGHHVTMDLARGLNTRIADAERIKAIYGSVLTGGSDERDMITVPPVGDDEREPPQFVSRAALVRIIKPRVEEILEMVRDRLASLAVRGRAARPRGPDRRRQPARRHRRSRGAHPAPSGAYRAPARLRGPAGRGQGSGLRRGGRPAGLPAGGASRTLRTAANAAIDDRNGRLHGTGRTMAARKLLTHSTQPRRGRWRTGLFGGVQPALAQVAQRALLPVH